MGKPRRRASGKGNGRAVTNVRGRICDERCLRRFQATVDPSGVFPASHDMLYACMPHTETSESVRYLDQLLRRRKMMKSRIATLFGTRPDEPSYVDHVKNGEAANVIYRMAV